MFLCCSRLYKVSPFPVDDNTGGVGKGITIQSVFGFGRILLVEEIDPCTAVTTVPIQNMNRM